MSDWHGICARPRYTRGFLPLPALLMGKPMSACHKCDLRVVFDRTLKRAILSCPWKKPSLTSFHGQLGERGNQRRRFACVSKNRRGVGTHSNGRETVEGFPHQSQHPSCPANAHSIIVLQPADGLRGRERRGAVVHRSSDAAGRGRPCQSGRKAGRVEQRTRMVRDGDARQQEEPHVSHEFAGRVGRFSAAAAASQESDPRHGQLLKRRTGISREPPTTGTSSAVATTRCSCSSSSATWNGGAVDQGGQEYRQLATVLLLALPGQPRPAPTLRVGLQSGELPPTAGTAQERAPCR